MFNFFDEIKDKCHIIKDKVLPYKLILLGDFILYFEGNLKLMTLSGSVIVFKTQAAIITINGENLEIKEISDCTLIITGKIKNVENV